MTLSALNLPIPSGQSPKGLVILLHGWGANAQDLVDLSPALQIPGAQFALPNAPLAHPYNPTGRMWYDLESQHWDGLDEARSQLSQWITECIETSGFSPEQVILAGFSQGGAMALDVGLERSLAGLIIFSGYLHPQVKARLQGPLPSAPPVLILHGQQDAVVPYQAAHHIESVLSEWQVDSKLHAFPTMGHEISDRAVDKARDFILSVLS